ncbi:MAG: right-handed parallel beta-helix repeat-containing protein [Polyangia bacterium]
MKAPISLAILCLGVSAAASVQAADYYVDTKGSDSNPGTMAQPFATLQKGVDVAVAGDTVYIRGGTYKVASGASSMAGVNFAKSGQSDSKRINYFAYAGETPVFDFSQLQLSASATSAGFYVTGSWLHFKGIEISHVPMPGTVSNNGLWAVGASNNTYELLNAHHNSGPGISIAKGNGGNLVLNCDSHDNYDANAAQGAGQNADGFGCHYQTSGPSTIYRGCRAWWNSDDGYDLISQEVPVTFENSWAMGNGTINSGTGKPGSGNGNGFKAGSSKTGIRHVIRNCVAWKNTAAGFYANHSSGGNTWTNNTSYNNGTQYNMLASPSGDTSMTITLTGSLVHIMRNNIGFPNKNANMTGVDTAANTWDLNITPSTADFASVDDADFMGPRQADGSLPDIPFMKLKAGSQMIDKGKDVMLPFAGAAPDLGAYEYGATTATGAGGSGAGTGGQGQSGGTAGGPATGGAPGTGGSVGAGGATGTGGSVGTGGRTTTGSGGQGTSAGAGGSPTGGGTGGSVTTGAAGPDGQPPGDNGGGSGCNCAIGAAGQGSTSGALLGLGILVATALRRRRR